MITKPTIESFSQAVYEDGYCLHYNRSKLEDLFKTVYKQHLDCLNQLEELEQLELPIWEDEDIESEDYIETINKNGKIKMEEE